MECDTAYPSFDCQREIENGCSFSVKNWNTGRRYIHGPNWQ